MNIVDATLLGLILFLGFKAYSRGLVHEAFTILAWIGAAALAYKAFPATSSYVRTLTSDTKVADGWAVAVVFLPSLFILLALVRRLAAGTGETSLGAIDKLLGLSFGLARGIVIVALAWILVSRAAPIDTQPDWLAEAKSQEMVGKYGPMVLKSLLPAKYLAEMNSHFDAALEKARSAAQAARQQP